jgi:DNA invertase Pin-like site-specific DNA recombinase
MALIWDRTPTTLVDSGTLLARISECEEYARAQGWEIAGTWVDSGEIAVTADIRPELDRAVAQADEHRYDEHGRPRAVLLLVHSNDRFSNDALWAASLRYRIREAGVRVVLMVEDTDRHVCAAEAVTAR